MRRTVTIKVYIKFEGILPHWTEKDFKNYIEEVLELDNGDCITKLEIVADAKED